MLSRLIVFLVALFVVSLSRSGHGASLVLAFNGCHLKESWLRYLDMFVLHNFERAVNYLQTERPFVIFRYDSTCDSLTIKQDLCVSLF
jgi:hypothetical protein